MSLRLTVIVADDDAAMRFVCRVNLELEGFRVLEAASASEVRRLVAEEEVDVVLLDARLGHDDGVVLARQLRSARPDLPIALLTGDTRANDPEARAVADHIIGKPFALDELVAIVRELAGARERAGDLRGVT